MALSEFQNIMPSSFILPSPVIAMPEEFPCIHPNCDHIFSHQSFWTQHYNSCHQPLSPDAEPNPALEFHIQYHPKLNGISSLCFCDGYWLTSSVALPCDEQGNFLPPNTLPPPLTSPDAIPSNFWHPFEDRLAFDQAYYHFIELQWSEQEINKGLDLWLAMKMKAGNNMPSPWSSTQKIYQTIDSIQEGDAPFITIQFMYSGPIPPNAPAWMTQTYELCMHDAWHLLHNQLAMTGLPDGAFNEKPYCQFNHEEVHIWSNLMSGEWAWTEAVHI